MKKKKINILNVSSAELIDALTWSKKDDEELRKELESDGYPKELIKMAFDKKDIRALNKLIAITDERIEKRKNKLSDWFEKLCTQFFATKISCDGFGSSHAEIFGEEEDKQARQQIEKLIRNEKK